MKSADFSTFVPSNRRSLRLTAYVLFLALILGAFGGTAMAQIPQIQHIVIIVKENRSFDNLFGTFPGADGATQGPISTGQILQLSHTPDAAPRDLCHTWNCNIVAVDGGRMDKWDITIGSALFACNVNGDYLCYSQYQSSDIPNYWTLASNYLLADHQFSSIHATTFPNHMYAVAAEAYGIIGQPHLISDSSQGESGCKSDPGSSINVLTPSGAIINPFPCFDFPAITDLLDSVPKSQGGPISWHFYSPDNSPYDPLEAINHIRNNSDWSSHQSLDSQFVTDVQAGNLAAVNWIVTNDQTSEHPPWSECIGENWTMTQISAIMQSPFWNNTAIFVIWDDSGGFYDHSVPPVLDQYGLGPRTPMLIVSPYSNTQSGHVIHTQYEPSSIIKFIEQVFDVNHNLGGRDVNANSVIDAFNFNQSPLPPVSVPQRSCSPVSNVTLNFPPQQVGQASQAKTVTIANYSSDPLNIQRIAISSGSSDYTQNNNCPATIPPPSPGTHTCTINIIFKPTATGIRSGALTVQDSDPGSPQTVAITGMGSNISLNPNPVSFGNVSLGQTKNLTATMKNNGSTSLSISNIVTAGDYTETDNCGSSLSAGSTCTFTMTFRPTTTGTRYGSITITDSDGSSPQLLNLTGTGTDIVLSPSSLSFNTVALGKASAPQPVTLTNHSTGDLGINSISIGGSINQIDTNFAQSSNCPPTLSSGASCTINVQFTPVSTGIQNGQLLISTSEASTTPLAVTLQGTGQANPVPLIVEPLFPTKAAPGGAGFTLTVNGSGFISGATVNWNGTALTTTFVSASQLTATVPSANIATAGTALITVSNGTPGGGVSNLALFPVTSGSTPANLSKTDVSVGSAPLGIARGDFNGDHVLDLAVVNNGGNTVSILLGNGDGTFTLKSTPPVGVQPTAVAVGDFNEDGKQDLAVSNYCQSTTTCGVSGSLTILLGNGDGTFTPSSVSPQIGPGPKFVVTGDFSQDGWLDLATANFLENYGSAMTGDGDGTFTAGIGGPTTGQGPDAIAVADFTGDGILDLAYANQGDNTISILPGSGDGSFSWMPGPTPGNQPSAILAADFNNDGKPDLAVANQADSTISIFTGNGDGTFNPQSNNATGTGPTSLAVGDFDGDGNLDLASANSTANSVSILLGNGTGVFPNHSDSATGTTPNSLVAGDFNKDGKLDLAVTNNAANTVSILVQGTSGGPIASISPTSLTFGTQLVGTVSSPQTVTLTNTGTATLNISAVTVTGDFTKQNQCSTTLAPGNSCNVQISFKPRTQGTGTGTLSFSDNAPGSPQTVPLTGTGTIVKVSPTSLTFSGQHVGTKSAPQTITVTNVSRTNPVTFSKLQITGTNSSDFHDGTTCSISQPLAAGGSCTITVTFKPGGTGTRTANVSLTDDGGGSPQVVPLTGTGT